ncbi:CSPP1 protein, partial [Alcedo cyanopectus]|nr:CSPP1 protein [Ceyx cyanopectus]
LRKEGNEFLKSSLLESDSAFIDANGEMFPALEEVNSSPEQSLSARERRRLKQKALECAVRRPGQEDVPRGQTPSLPPDSSSSRCSFSPEVAQLRGWNEGLLHGLAELQHKAAYSGRLRGADAENTKQLHSADTVATEAWLRPGTSETLHSVLDPEHSPAKAAPARALPLRWQGLSTAHG